MSSSHREGRAVIWNGLTVAALIIATTALALALAVMRQNGTTTEDLRRHRRAHADAFGHPDPKLDRRQVNIGAPRSTGERRGARRYEPPPERLAPRPVDDEVAARAEQYAEDERRWPTSGQAEPPTDPGEDTGELEQHDLPTTAMPAMPPLRRPEGTQR